ncbi:MAG: hypothetical protein Q9164_005440 [Protoblastenia rupestris]
MIVKILSMLAFATTILSVPLEQHYDVVGRPSSNGMFLNKREAPTLQDCLAAGNVPVRFISSPDFSERVRPFNLRLPYTPTVIVLPTTTEHVSTAVVCAGQSNVKVQARSGGHSYASFGIGGQDGSMVIDLESFQNISADANGTATVGAGVRLGNLALGIYNQAKRALPHGTCPGVGIGGHATHGGFGYSSRAWGLTLDTIIGMDTILANGTLIHVTRNSHPDLFYALRGDASDFGIITTFYLATFPAPETVVNWQYNLPGMFTDPQASAEVFQHIQSFALNTSLIDRNLGLGVYLDGGNFYISGTYFGPLSTFTETLAPALLNGLPTPSNTNVRALSWLDSLVALANNAPLAQPLTGYNAHDTFFAKSVTTPASDPLTAAQLNTYFTYIINNGVNKPETTGYWFSIINLYGGQDSQINAVPTADAAYDERTSLWVAQHYTSSGSTDVDAPPLPGSGIEFVEGLNEALTSVMAGEGVEFGAYQNYVDASLAAGMAHDLYYEDGTFARLVELKRLVDPGRVFWNPHSVGN